MRRLITWASEWVETLRIAPPFSRRRRDILAAIRDADNPDSWAEVHRPS
jgi:hypothetical protein